MTIYDKMSKDYANAIIKKNSKIIFSINLDLKNLGKIDSKPCPPEFEKTVDEQFWELI